MTLGLLTTVLTIVCLAVRGVVSADEMTPPEVSRHGDMTPANVTWNASDVLHSETNGSYDGDSRPGSSAELQRLIQAARSALGRFYNPVMIPLGIFSCITTIWVLQKGALRSSSSIYITAIASSNLIYMVNLALYNLTYYEEITKTKAWQNFNSYYAAYISSSAAFFAMSSNSWTVVAFAVDRSIAIFYPLKAIQKNNEARARKIVICIFILALLQTIPRLFAMYVTIEKDPITNETMHVSKLTEFGANPLRVKIENLLFSLSVILVPVPLLGVMNIVIILKLRLQANERRRLQEVGADASRAKQRQIERVLVASLWAFFICNVMQALTATQVAIHGIEILRYFNFELRIQQLVGISVYTAYPTLNFLLNVCCSKILQDAVKAHYGMGYCTKRAREI